MGETRGTYVGRRNTYKVSVGGPERNRSSEKSSHRWEVAIQMCLKERGSEVVDWIQLAEDGTNGGFCYLRLYKMRGISLAAEELLASQEALCFIVTFIHSTKWKDRHK